MDVAQVLARCVHHVDYGERREVDGGRVAHISAGPRKRDLAVVVGATGLGGDTDPTDFDSSIAFAAFGSPKWSNIKWQAPIAAIGLI